MLHPSELAPVNERKDPRSALMKAKGKAVSGAKVNACPFGCEDVELDENGYCRHLVGFTEDKKHYEPMVVGRDGRRVVQVPMVRDEERSTAEFEATKPLLMKVEKDDTLIQITTSYRVYRNTPKRVVAKSA